MTDLNQIINNLLRNGSYTSRDYQAIITDLMSMFRGEDRITDNWDNLSESDPLFIMMHLVALITDKLNYQLDYRIQENFISTAKERASIVRNSNSYGYKIPSYKAGRVVFRLDNPSIPDKLYNLPKGFMFLDSRVDNGTMWTYMGEPKQIKHGDEIELFQGRLTTISNISPVNISAFNKTYLLGNANIAIGNSYDDKPMSFLVDTNNPSRNWEEVENLNTYIGDNPYVYELNVDPLGSTYMRFPYELSIDTGSLFTMSYLVTLGSTIINVSSELTAVLTPVSGGANEELKIVRTNEQMSVGQDPADVATIRENFKAYYAGINSLVTLTDYVNYLLKNQVIDQEITKAQVVDKYDATVPYTGDYITGDTSLEPWEVKLFVNKEVSDISEDLIKEIDYKKASPKQIIYEKAIDKAIKVSITPDINGSINNAIQTIILNNIRSKGIGDKLAGYEIQQEIMSSRNSSLYPNGVSVRIGAVSGGATSLTYYLGLGEIATISINDITLDV